MYIYIGNIFISITLSLYYNINIPKCTRINVGRYSKGRSRVTRT